MLLLLWAFLHPVVFYHCLLAFIVVTLLVGYRTKRFLFQQKYPSMLTRSATFIEDLRANTRSIMCHNQRRAANQPHYNLALVILVLLVSTCNQSAGLEQDAQLLKPLESLAKSLISTITLGKPLEINFNPTSLARGLASLAWRTGFPVTMPSDFVFKSQDFYNRIMIRVGSTDITLVTRKPLESLKDDLDLIVDSIVENVRQSPDGLYTNYLDVQVEGIPLEEACYQIGVQLKAYGVDLTNYRNIAGAVLGIPILPQVASTVVGVASLAPGIGLVTNLTTGTVETVGMLPAAALDAVSQVSDTAMSSIRALPLGGTLFGPRSYPGPVVPAEPPREIVLQVA